MESKSEMMLKLVQVFLWRSADVSPVLMEDVFPVFAPPKEFPFPDVVLLEYRLRMEFQLLFCVERFFRSKLIVKLLEIPEILAFHGLLLLVKEA